MLIEAPYKVGDTVSIKLTSGEEVVARYKEQKNDDTMMLHKPLMVTATQQGLGLAPFMFTIGTEATVSISNDKVVCVVKTQDDMSKQYIQSTTGIAT
jgi:hypothetical protein|tara:strand:- start:723 stop:1013 length:291 start_codon:yes stop_codon:yes gene_type:complete